MNNPYKPSNAVIPPPLPAGRRHAGLLLGIGLACSAIPVVIAALAVPQFRDVFAAFGSDLPWLTRAMVGFYPALAVLPLAVVAARAAWPWPFARPLAACVLGIVLMLASVALVIVSLYLPIYKLASVV